MPQMPVLHLFGDFVVGPHPDDGQRNDQDRRVPERQAGADFHSFKT